MPNTFFTSDLHFFHKKILQLCPTTRAGCATLAEMHDTICKKWNETVSIGDDVYILGDVSFGKTFETLELLSTLNGNLHLVKGNHDSSWLSYDGCREFFVEVTDYKVLKLDKKYVTMFHYPIAEHDRCQYGSYHLHGHTHGNYRVPGRVLDVGIDNRDQCDMGLWSWEDIVEYMEARPFTTHHKYPK